MIRLTLSSVFSGLCAVLLASVLAPHARAQLKWSAYDNAGALIGTQNQAATFDPATGSYVFSVPAAGQYTFVTTNFVPLTMAAPVSGTTIQTIAYKMKSSAGWTNAIPGNRINQLGLFSYGATAPAATGNFSDDNGLFANFKGGSWGNEVFGGTTAVAGLLGGYQSAIKLGSGKTNGTTVAWTLADDSFVNVTLRIALTSAGAFSLGTSSAYANAGLVVEDSSAVGAGSSYQAIYSGAASAVTAPKIFNEFAFYYRNDAATTATITITDFTGLTPPPYFTAVTGQPPATLTGSTGDNLSITVSAVGNSVVYQWQKSTDDGASFSPIDTGANASAATATLLLNSVQASDVGQYRVIISNGAGATTSTACAVTVTSGAVAPSVQTDPQPATILVGGSNTFSVAASGTAPLGYQWSRSTDSGVTYTDITNATGSTYALSSAQLSDTGLYRVTVTNSAGHATSAAAALTVNQLPAFTTQPVGSDLSPGGSLTLTADATIGTPAPIYQWKLNNVAIQDATAATYSITNATGANAGNYTVVATNAAGSTTSSTATVNVISPSLSPASFLPAGAATGVFPDQSLQLTFNQAITAGLAGLIKIYDASNPSTPVDTISFASAAARTASASQVALPVQSQSIGGQSGFNYYPVTIAGSKLTVHPRNGTLTYGKTYYLTIDAGVILDSSGATYAGFSDSNTWRFTTKAAAPTAGSAYLTVASDGSGDFYTVQGALDFIPAANTTPTTIYIKDGTYYELVSWTAKSNLTFVGQSRAGTIVGYNNNNNFNPTGTAWRAAFTCRGSSTGIVLTNLTIRNSTPKTGTQAEALYLNGSATAQQAVITNVNLLSYQDTLLINGQAYVNNSYFEGDTDFMWGTGPVFFTNCEFKAMSIQSYYTQVRNPATNHGFVFVNCTFSAAPADSQNSASPISGCYLGRLDQNSSPHTEMVLLNCLLGDHILPVAWNLNGQTVPGASATDCAEFNSRKISDNSLVDISGRASWSYQWTTPANDTQIANYSDAVWVLNTSMTGTVLSSWTPALAPIFLSQPASATVSEGAPAAFTASVSAIPAGTYQWKKNGNAIGGATAATYAIASATIAAAGDYTVTVTNTAGAVTSSAATLTVQVPPPAAPTAGAATSINANGFTANWAAASGATGYRLDVSADHTFATFAAGYQNLNIGNNLARAVAGLGDGTLYYYRVRAYNASGSGDSSATITVTTATRTNLGVMSSGTTTSSAYSLGGSAYTQNFDTLPASGTFTWTNDSTLPGWYAAPTTGSLNTIAVTGDGTSNLADLTLASVGTSGSSDRALAYQTRLNTAPTYIGLAFTNNSGREITSFSLTYAPEQWRENTTQRDMTFAVQYRVGATATDLNVASGWTTISGLDFTSAGGSVGAAATLTATAVAVSVPAGSTLWFRWVCANNATSSTSSNDIIAIDNVSVSLTAVPDGSPVITTQPASQAVAAGANATLTVVASGDSPLSYQWRKGASDVSGATSSTLTITGAQSGDAGSYTVVVTNAKGAATSEAAVLTVNVPTAPAITTPPQSQTVTAGANVTFTVVATGSAPLSYLWKHDGVSVTGGTTDTLVLSAVQSADAGAYTVDVSNSVSTVTSAAASLTVQPAVPQAPAITTQPAAQTVAAGGIASFSVAATGTAPLTYQWFKGAAAISGATASTLTLSNVQTSDSGSYSVTVTNGLGSAPSAAVALTVSVAQPYSAYNLTGFATVGSGTTGGGVIPDTDIAYRKCYTPLDFVQAILDSNKTAGKVKVIEIMNDLSLGWIEVGATVQGLASNPLRSHNAPKLHPVLLTTGVSVIDIKAKSPLTIFSAHGATIKHVNFNVKGTANIIIRNLKFDEMWEWDEASKGNYDSNDWDFITLSNGGAVTNIWIDHCTFTKSYDGIVDLKAGTQYATLSWCRYLGDDGATNPNSWVRQQLAALEANRSAYPFYNFLRTNGYSVDDIATIIQGHDKGHLMGSNSLDPANATLSATFHHQWFQNVWDRVVPRLRAGNVHDYNIYVDDVVGLAARRLRDLRALALSSGLQNTLNNTYSFNPFLNGTISTENGAILVENSIYSDCLWPLRNNQTDPSNPVYTGKIKALDTIYSFHNSDSTTTLVRGNSTDAGSPLGPFQAPVVPFSWNLSGNQLPYAYTLDDPAQLPAILALGAGAGTLTWSKDNWLRTAYVVDTTIPPSIVGQPQAITVATGADATFLVEAIGSATLSYQWKKDGAALTDDGRISGSTSAVLTIAATTLSDAGTYSVVVTNPVSNVTSIPAALAVITATLPVISTQPQPQTVITGAAASFGVVATGTAPLSYQWQRGGTNLAGETGSTLTIASVQLADAGSYTVVATNTAGSVTSAAATLTVGNPSEITSATTASGTVGTTFSYQAVASNSPTSYSATDLPPGLTINSATGLISGTPAASGTFLVTLRAGNFAGAGPDIVLTVTLAPAPDARLVNIATRGEVGTDANVLIVGFVITGTDPKPVIIRGVGPTLGGYGVSGTLPDPTLELNRGGTVIGQNDNWSTAGDPATVSASMARVGAFSLNPGSLDSVIYTTLAPGVYSAILRGNGAANTGVGIVEIYDATETLTATSPRLVNISTRGRVGTADSIMIAGFVVTGNQAKQVLIRGVGPTLGGYGVADTLVDPLLRLLSGSTVITQNDNWGSAGDSAAIIAAAVTTGAFPLTSASKDAVILTTLQPGAYTAQVSGVSGATGVALVEIYEIP